jgi:hypothetical protein
VSLLVHKLSFLILIERQSFCHCVKKKVYHKNILILLQPLGILHFLKKQRDSNLTNSPKFWKDRWLNGKTIDELAPNLIKAIPKRSLNKRTVAEALNNRR